jgi:hypothetical protein
MESETQIDVYKEVLTAIVQRFIRLMGSETAIRLARRVYGLKVDDEGRATSYQGDGWIAIQGLVIEYMTLLGPQVVPMTQRAITPAVERHPNKVKLPSLLRE